MPDQYFGKYSGIVIKNQDAQNLGRLEVSVPDLFGDAVFTAYPALPYGWFFVPEPKEHVWVEFQGGDTDEGQPLWTGMQCIPGKWPNQPKASSPEKRFIETASGHLIVFDDDKSGGGIEILDGLHHGQSITLNKGGITVKSQSGTKLELTDTGVIVETTGTIEIKGVSVSLGNALPAGPVMRAGIDQAIGNLGAPVVMISTSKVIAS